MRTFDPGEPQGVPRSLNTKLRNTGRWYVPAILGTMFAAFGALYSQDFGDLLIVLFGVALAGSGAFYLRLTRLMVENTRMIKRLGPIQREVSLDQLCDVRVRRVGIPLSLQLRDAEGRKLNITVGAFGKSREFCAIVLDWVERRGTVLDSFTEAVLRAGLDTPGD